MNEEAENIDIETEELETEVEETTLPDLEESEVTIEIDGESLPPNEEEESKVAPEWVKELRHSHKEAHRKIKALEEENAKLKPKEVAPVLEPKPTLESCAFDDEEFEQKLEVWFEQKKLVEQKEKEKELEKKQASDSWNLRVATYTEEKTKLKVKNFTEVEEVVKSSLSITQQGIILQGSDKAALIVYALGSNPKKLDELSKIIDPVKFAFAIAHLENKLKVTEKKSAPAPERRVSGNSPVSGALDGELERLRAEAEKTGNYSKVHAYKQSVKNKK
jgi:hypothetical protein